MTDFTVKNISGDRDLFLEKWDFYFGLYSWKAENVSGAVMASGQWQWDIGINNIDFASTEKCPASDLILWRLILRSLRRESYIKSARQRAESPKSF